MIRYERRIPRDLLTKALERMCSRLDQAHVREVSFRDRFLDIAERAVVRVAELWVFGSYSRGGAECGDLDAVAKIVVEEGHQPYDGPLNRVFFGAPPHVHTIFDTDPLKCFDRMSDRSVKEAAVLIWREDEATPAWRQRLLEVAPARVTATRYQRDLDDLPVRPDVLYPHTDVENIIRLRRERVITWEFHEFGSPVECDTLTSDEQQVESWVRNFGSVKLKRVLPYLFAHCRQHLPGQLWRREFGDTLEFHVGSAVLLTGRPHVPARWLEGTEYSALLIAPYISGRGPNGVWTIKRDIANPLVKVLRECSAYYFASQDGRADEISYMDVHNIEGVAIELFRSKRQARAHLSHIGSSEYEPKILFAPDGDAVLRLLHGVDLVMANDQDFVLTRHGYAVLHGGRFQPDFKSDVAALASYLGSRTVTDHRVVEDDQEK